MKRVKLVLLMVLTASLMISCQDENIGQGTILPPNPAGEDVAGLVLHIGSVQTRANPVEVLTGETDVKSIACFVRTKEQGTVGDPAYKQGAFLPFFITDAADITDNGDGSFKINLEVYSPSVAGKTDVAIITNYKENGLETTLQKVEKWEDLFRLVSTPVTATGMATPLLMFGYKEVALSHTVPAVETINLQRLVARFDIENKAANAPKKPFLLKSAEIIHPKQYTYLLPGNEDTYDIPVLDSGFNKVNSTDDKNIKGLYTYETANDGTVAHTTILIRGILDGKAYNKRIDLMKAGKIIPLERNTRYLITLTPAAEGEGIDWAFTVDDWSEGTIIPVKPEYQKPVTSNITFEDAAGKSITTNTWDNTMKACQLVTVNTGDKIKFSVENLQNTKAVANFISGEWADLGITDEAGQKAFIQRKSSTVETRTLIKEEYEITFPAMPTNAFEMEIRLESETKPGYFESFRVTFQPDFNCKIEEPKMINKAGKDITIENWDLSSQTFYVDQPTANYKISFKIKTFQGAKAEITAISGSLNDLGIAQKDIRKTGTTPSGNYVIETYEVTFPKAVNKTFKAEIKISNTVKSESFEKITLRSDIVTYPNAGRAVRIGNVYWATLNVGATTTDNTDNGTLASTGYYYQWGRNQAFNPHASISKAKGPTEWSNRDNSTFYYNDNASTQYDWLQDNGSDRITRDAYWSTPANTPCPAGWRLPTKKDGELLLAARKGELILEETKNRHRLTGSDGQYLYFPRTSYLDYDDGVQTWSGSSGSTHVWTSDKETSSINKSEAHILMLETWGTMIFVPGRYVSTGYPIRCVKSL
ncbi:MULTISPECIES: FISUMP domain-containing protein [unclassified Parabacteroides]|uniref:FISUMP domain-containing protein n=1 Tax=unclassified Parabacteroides TaxID=2649774 RepID=UPI0013D13473|nr:MULTISPECIES: FISUMP domain-containing protein [unclassified Parabacteroides]